MSAVNRRTVIAAAASVAALGAATPAAGRQSRFAEVTATFEAARKAFMDAIDAEQKADALLKQIEREPILGPMVNGCRVEVRGRDRDEAYDEQEKAIAQHGQKLRRQLASIGADTSVVDEWELRMTEEAIAAVETWQGRRDDCGYTAAQTNLMAAMDAENDAVLDVMAYRPVSHDDARAKALWVRERLIKDELSSIHGAFECLLESTLPEGEELHEQENGSWTIASAEAA